MQGGGFIHRIRNVVAHWISTDGNQNGQQLLLENGGQVNVANQSRKRKNSDRVENADFTNKVALDIAQWQLRSQAQDSQYDQKVIETYNIIVNAKHSQEQLLNLFKSISKDDEHVKSIEQAFQHLQNVTEKFVEHEKGIYKKQIYEQYGNIAVFNKMGDNPYSSVGYFDSALLGEEVLKKLKVVELQVEQLKKAESTNVRKNLSSMEMDTELVDSPKQEKKEKDPQEKKVHEDKKVPADEGNSKLEII